MTNANLKVVEATHAPQGPQGQKYLAHGDALAMRLWENESPGDEAPATRRSYETVGYVISGEAELTLEGRKIALKPGVSWVVPKDAEHSYRFLKSFTAIEATSPPAEDHNRDANPVR